MITNSYKFNDMDMADEDTYKVTIRMFMEFGLIQQFQIPYRVSDMCNCPVVWRKYLKLKKVKERGREKREREKIPNLIP